MMDAPEIKGDCKRDLAPEALAASGPTAGHAEGIDSTTNNPVITHLRDIL
jgi:hypothetical protein